jgi:putative membrane protein
MKTVKMLVSAALLGWMCLPGCADGTKNPEKQAMEANEAKTETNRAEEDAETMVQAAVSDMMEIQSSQIAATMATQPAVKEYANMMVTEHTNMSSQTKDLAARKGFSLPAALDQDHMDDLEDMRKWAKGEEFDTKYMAKQVDMHQKTLDELEDRMEASADIDVKAWAQAASSKVRMHLDRAKQLKDEVDAAYDNN